MIIQRNNKGMTLVELLVAMSVFMLVLGLVGGIYVNYVGKQKQQLSQQFLQQDLQNFFDTIERDVRTSYGDTLSVVGSWIDFYNQEQKRSDYFLVSNAINHNFTKKITSTKISINKLNFTLSSPAPTPASDSTGKMYLSGSPMRVTISARACLLDFPTDCIDAQTTVTSRQTNPFPSSPSP
jgi:type II secretory pathway pseudopilin PulG